MWWKALGQAQGARQSEAAGVINPITWVNQSISEESISSEKSCVLADLRALLTYVRPRRQEKDDAVRRRHLRQTLFTNERNNDEKA